MTPTSFAELLQAAVTEPDIISSAYRQFHSYSLSISFSRGRSVLSEGCNPVRWRLSTLVCGLDS